MATWFAIGIVCALAAWVIHNIKPAPFEPESHDFDQRRVDSIFAELDVQEMKTRKVKAI